MTKAESRVRVRRETVVASEIFRRSKRIASQRPLAVTIRKSSYSEPVGMRASRTWRTRPVVQPTAQCTQGLIPRSGWESDSGREIPYHARAASPTILWREPPF